MADPTIVYFGQDLSTVLMMTSNGFDGTSLTGLPSLSPGLYSFPVQAGGGLYSLHTEPVVVRSIAFKGSGSLSIRKVFGGQEAVVATIANGQGELLDSITLSPGESLKLYSTGAATVAITAQLANLCRMV